MKRLAEVALLAFCCGCKPKPQPLAALALQTPSVIVQDACGFGWDLTYIETVNPGLTPIDGVKVVKAGDYWEICSRQRRTR